MANPRLGDLLEDRWVGSPVDAVIASNVQEETAVVLKTLSPKEEIIIRMRFGIGCDREYTLAEIAQEFALTRERIRQIEAEALLALKLSRTRSQEVGLDGCASILDRTQSRSVSRAGNRPVDRIGNPKAAPLASRPFRRTTTKNDGCPLLREILNLLAIQRWTQR